MRYVGEHGGDHDQARVGEHPPGAKGKKTSRIKGKMLCNSTQGTPEEFHLVPGRQVGEEVRAEPRPVVDVPVDRVPTIT